MDSETFVSNKDTDQFRVLLMEHLFGKPIQ
jgi:hypothetical protein